MCVLNSSCSYTLELMQFEGGLFQPTKWMFINKTKNEMTNPSKQKSHLQSNDLQTCANETYQIYWFSMQLVNKLCEIIVNNKFLLIPGLFSFFVFRLMNINCRVGWELKVCARHKINNFQAITPKERVNEQQEPTQFELVWKIATQPARCIHQCGTTVER